MPASNSENFAEAARPDKVRFVYRGLDPLEGHRIWAEWVQTVAEMNGWSEEYTRRHVRMMPYHRGKDRAGTILQLTWKACDLCYSLSPGWMGRCQEVEMKAYVDERFEGAFEAFLDHLAASDELGRLNTHFYTNGAHASTKKGKRSRSVTMGSKKSEKSVKAYKRQGERPGLEVAVRGKAVKKIAADVADYVDGQMNPDDVRKLWRVFLRRVARVGFAAAYVELVKRQVDLSKYFEAFVNLPTDEEPGEEEARFWEVWPIAGAGQHTLPGL